jgi:hypothetical protein
VRGGDMGIGERRERQREKRGEGQQGNVMLTDLIYLDVWR